MFRRAPVLFSFGGENVHKCALINSLGKLHSNTDVYGAEFQPVSTLENKSLVSREQHSERLNFSSSIFSGTKNKGLNKLLVHLQFVCIAKIEKECKETNAADVILIYCLLIK